MKRITAELIRFLKEKKLTIAFAESMSCGLITHQLNTVPGTSSVLKGSIICYDEDVKTGLLKIPRTVINKFTSESQIVTDKLCINLKKLIRADIHCAITGLSTDGGSETKQKPVGTVFFSILYKSKIHKLRKHFRSSPLEIKKASCECFYIFILRVIKKESKLHKPRSVIHTI